MDNERTITQNVSANGCANQPLYRITLQSVKTPVVRPTYYGTKDCILRVLKDGAFDSGQLSDSSHNVFPATERVDLVLHPMEVLGTASIQASSISLNYTGTCTSVSNLTADKMTGSLLYIRDNAGMYWRCIKAVFYGLRQAGDAAFGWTGGIPGLISRSEDGAFQNNLFYADMRFQTLQALHADLAAPEMTKFALFFDEIFGDC